MLSKSRPCAFGFGIPCVGKLFLPGQLVEANTLKVAITQMCSRLLTAADSAQLKGWLQSPVALLLFEKLL